MTAAGSAMRFRLLPPDGGANALEEELLARWREEKVRQPLARMVCVVPQHLAGDVAQLFDLIEAELNVKAITAAPSSSDELRAFEHGEPLAISVGNESRTFDADDLMIVRRATGALTVKEEDGRFAAIDPAVTPELRREGIARELVSQLQRLRRDLGFAVSGSDYGSPLPVMWKRRSRSTMIGSPMNYSPGTSP